MKLKERLDRYFSSEGGSPANLSRATGIPAPRIYKWRSGDGSPKEEDAETLKKFFLKIEDVTERDIKKSYPLMDRTSEEWKVIRLLINEIASLQSKATGVGFADCLAEMDNKVNLVLAGK